MGGLSVFSGFLQHLKLLPGRAAALGASWFWADGGAGAWSVLKISVHNRRLFSWFLGGRRRWCVERPQKSVRNRRPFRGFIGRTAALERGASSEILFVTDDLSVVLGRASVKGNPGPQGRPKTFRTASVKTAFSSASPEC